MAKRQTERLDLDAVFSALAHPVRRQIIERLAQGDAGVNELARPFDLSLPTISRHLRVLEEAGLVQVDREWRVRRRRINAAPLSVAFGWLTQYRILWEDRLDRFGTVLGERGRSAHSPERTPSKRRK